MTIDTANDRCYWPQSQQAQQDRNALPAAIEDVDEERKGRQATS